MALAQESRVITGSVISKNTKEPLTGATVLIKGTKKGAVTNFEGQFLYTVKEDNIAATVLVFSSIGYQTQEIIIGNQSTFYIELAEDIESLQEVVITSSYGTKKRKEEVVGSMVTIKPTQIATEQPAITIDELLEGQAAGVLVETNPNLGEPVRIDIRGQGSLTPLNNNQLGTSTQPLIIVDGIILSEELGIDGSNFFDAGEGALSENFLNPLARVGIQDIESIEILKDAAAVGLYGANAANGVILITTSGGKKGKLSFNASIQGGISTAYDRIKYMSGEQYNELRNLYYTNNGEVNNIRPWNGINTDWFELLNQNGSFTRYSIGATTGGEKFRFRGSVTYQNRVESQIANDFNQLNTSFALDYGHNKWKASLRVAPSITTKNNPNTLYNFAVDPTLPVRDENGDFTRFASFGNPLAVAQQNRSWSQTMALLTSFNLSYAFNDHLNIRTLIGSDFSNKDEDRFLSGLNGSGQLGNVNELDPFDGNGELGRRILRGRDTRNWNWSANLSYSNTFKEKHEIEVIAGIETRGEKSLQSFVRGDDFEIFSRPQPISLANEIDEREDSIEQYGRSGFSQLNYNWSNTYFLLANFRVDQSSAFGGDNDTAINAGLGASWVISKESFLENLGWVDFLRLRASYGSTGNSRIGSYRALGLYSRNPNGYNGIDFANPTNTAPNPNLGWEKNYKFNIGVDLNFLNKYNLTLEYFRDDINDMIVSRPAIPESGYNNIQINGASMINSGVELSLTANWISNEKFVWNTSLNASSLRNEVTDLIGIGSDFSIAEQARSQQIGFPTSAIWGFESIGIDPATGRELFNVNGGVYDAAQLRSNFNENDWSPIGDSQPDLYGGMRNNFSFSNFNLNIITSYSIGGQQLVDQSLVDNYRLFFNRNLNLNAYYEAWREPGDVSAYPAVSNSNPLVRNSSRYLYDTSNIQLKSVTLSYELPTTQWKHLRSCSININGSNLFYYFFDQSANGRNGIAEFRNIYPQMRTISMGINTTF